MADRKKKNQRVEPYKDGGTTIDGEHGEKIVIRQKVDSEGRPAGGTLSAPGVSVDFQAGPIGEEGRTGAFVEDLLFGVAERLKWYQSGEFRCRENAIALTHIETALLWLNERTRARRERGVEGTYEK